MEEAKIYFTKDLTSKGLIKAYNAVGTELKGNVAVKLHSGEEGNQNFLRPEYVADLIEHVHGKVVECNTAYPGARTNNKDHKALLENHGWTKYFTVDLMDEDGDVELPIPNGKVIKTDYVGSHLLNYDSMLVLCHAKGHPMAGFGNCLKQLSIGCASRRGKAYIHSAGKYQDANVIWNDLPEQDKFLEAMADSAGTVHNHFKGNIVYVCVMKNISVDCDCCSTAEDPCMKDIGILSGTDPVALDQAFMDFIDSSTNPGKSHFQERVNSRHGKHVIDAADELGFGTKKYQIINLD
ncbi:MAG TPA: DUF362 domain-containing protein [Bacilli bacterium]|mgnify:CR=1 FL=1|nr:DUF362 domain-containing protein [Bacilli bacterium]